MIGQFKDHLTCVVLAVILLAILFQTCRAMSLQEASQCIQGLQQTCKNDCSIVLPNIAKTGLTTCLDAEFNLIRRAMQSCLFRRAGVKRRANCVHFEQPNFGEILSIRSKLFKPEIRNIMDNVAGCFRDCSKAKNESETCLQGCTEEFDRNTKSAINDCTYQVSIRLPTDKLIACFSNSFSGNLPS